MTEVTGLRVLVITRNAWDDTNSIGNTMSNFFQNQPDWEFANIYFRASKPNNTVCSSYFHVTEQDILRHWLSPEQCGSAFRQEPVHLDAVSGYSREKKLVSLVHRRGLRSAYALSDRLWESGKWINGRLAAFVEAFRPDVVFSFVKALPQYYHILRFLNETYHCSIKLWIADDEYTRLSRSNKKKDRMQIERLRYILGCATTVWGCSEEICDYYNRVFGCNATPLYKSCTFAYPVHSAVHSPLRLLYAGNLLFGRLEMLQRTARCLAALPEDGSRAVLDIYSSTPLSDADAAVFAASDAVRLHGVQPYQEIQRLMAQSDLVLHIESFDPAEQEKTRYSFSTKIIDCLQSGSVLLTIGPASLASVKYSKRIPGAFVIEEEEKLEPALQAVLLESGSFSERAAQIRDFAVRHHSADSKWLYQ